MKGRKSPNDAPLEVLCQGFSSQISTNLVKICFRLFLTLLTPSRGHAVRPLVNGEILLELGSELRSVAFPATLIDISGIRTHDSLRASRIF